MPRHPQPLRAALRPGALIVALCALTNVAAAQRAGEVALPDPRRAFDDSWFWGAKGGVVRFGTLTEGHVTAPLAGAEWLITRHQGALLVSAEQSFFDRTSVVADPYREDGAREVSMRDARRYSAAAVAAPVAIGRVRPYAGIGLAMTVIREAVPQGDFTNQQQYMSVRDRVDAGQSFVSTFLVGGVQAQYGTVALFVQGSVGAGSTRSLWNRGGASQLEAGVRYNLASAFEK